MPFQTGDRVRIKNTKSEYTGCRGTIADQPSAGSVTQLGHLVAIDGENGMTRPFLVGDLLPLRAARVRSDGAAAHSERTPRTGSGIGHDGGAE